MFVWFIFLNIVLMSWIHKPWNESKISRKNTIEDILFKSHFNYGLMSREKEFFGEVSWRQGLQNCSPIWTWAAIFGNAKNISWAWSKSHRIQMCVCNLSFLHFRLVCRSAGLTEWPWMFWVALNPLLALTAFALPKKTRHLPTPLNIEY